MPAGRFRGKGTERQPSTWGKQSPISGSVRLVLVKMLATPRSTALAGSILSLFADSDTVTGPSSVGTVNTWIHPECIGHCDELFRLWSTRSYCYNHGEMIGSVCSRALLPAFALLLIGSCSCVAARRPSPEANTAAQSNEYTRTQDLPAPGTAGPWDQDVLVFAVGADVTVTNTATFERAGVPAVARMNDGRLIAAHQYFPANNADSFDKVAVRFSSDEGYSWTGPEVIPDPGWGVSSLTVNGSPSGVLIRTQSLLMEWVFSRAGAYGWQAVVTARPGPSSSLRGGPGSSGLAERWLDCGGYRPAAAGDAQ
jgi:hypothetical protein